MGPLKSSFSDSVMMIVWLCCRAELVIFYDMVVGIDATLSMLRLVSSLYLGEQEVGQPAPLPCVLCQPGVEIPFSQQLPPGGYAPLLVKQPVPRKGHFSFSTIDCT